MPKRDLMVITNAINVAYHLAARLHLAVSPNRPCTISTQVFHGVFGLDAEHGLTSASFRQSRQSTE